MKTLTDKDKDIINHMNDTYFDWFYGTSCSYLYSCGSEEIRNHIIKTKYICALFLKFFEYLGISVNTFRLFEVSDDNNNDRVCMILEDLYDMESYLGYFFSCIMNLFGWKFTYVHTDSVFEIILKNEILYDDIYDFYQEEPERFREVLLDVIKTYNSPEPEVLCDMVVRYYIEGCVDSQILVCMTNKKIGRFLNGKHIPDEINSELKRLTEPLLGIDSDYSGIMSDGSYGCIYMFGDDPQETVNALGYDLSLLLDALLVNDYIMNNA